MVHTASGGCSDHQEIQSLRSGPFNGTLLYMVTSRSASATKMRGKTSA